MLAIKAMFTPSSLKKLTEYYRITVLTDGDRLVVAVGRSCRFHFLGIQRGGDY